MVGPATNISRGTRPWLSAASFWSPDYFVPSAWVEHAPFAFWVASATSPRIFAELGTHYGFSYFAFLMAMQRAGIESEAFALDSWEGDDQAGFYSDEVFDGVRAANAEFENRSHLLRGYFDESLDKFEDGAIDLLHIDGRHGYEDVVHDFESWLPKVSSRGVILFHDIAEHSEGFGVWRFWEEVCTRYPSFAFTHEHGLGVLGVGSDLPRAVKEFFEAATVDGDAIRADYETLGSRISRSISVENAANHFEKLAAQRSAEIDRLEERLRGKENQLAELRGSTSWRATKPLRSLTSLLHRT